MFVKLTREDGKTVYVNFDHVRYFESQRDRVDGDDDGIGSRLDVSDNNDVWVNESLEQILDALQK